MTAEATESRPAPVVQPLQAPVLRSEFRQLLASGVLIDRAGQPVPGLPCPTCGNPDDRYTCPGSLPCLKCSAGPGQRCTRPSGHASDTWHVARVRAAETIDDQREADGDPTLLAPWPE
ncbi:zinc finger domain-containing protein [Kitasatospora sp. NPDC004240]